MFFSKKDHLIGLDIGSSTIKVAEVVFSKKDSYLRSFSTIDLPFGAIEAGEVKNVEVVADAIRTLLKENNIREKNVAIAIGGYSVIIKNISLPVMTEKELHDTINFEAEQYIPFDINDVNLDFQILNTNEANSNNMNVLLVAVKKEILDDYIYIVELAGLNPCLVDVDTFALQNIYELNYNSDGSIDNEITALIDIGANRTSLNILKGVDSLFIRDVSLGCNNINKRIASLIGCPIEESEIIKLNGPGDKISNEDFKAIISSEVADWCTEITRALDFFYSTNPEDKIQKIVLSGGGANITEFQQLLGLQIDTNVSIINPFKELFPRDSNIDPIYLEKIAPQASISMGLAIRRIGDK